jgi:hypothetical protein
MRRLGSYAANVRIMKRSDGSDTAAIAHHASSPRPHESLGYFLSNVFQSVKFQSSLHATERVSQTHLRDFVQPSRALRSHVNIRRPPRRLQRHRRPEFLHRSIEGVCDGVRVDDLVRQEVLVKPLGHDRAIIIGHGPAGLLSVAAASNRHAHSPHRRNYTLEARV